jgi:hypothetical protein
MKSMRFIATHIRRADAAKLDIAASLHRTTRSGYLRWAVLEQLRRDGFDVDPQAEPGPAKAPGLGGRI